MNEKPLDVDEIRSRVKEVRRVRFGDVQANPENVKVHTKRQRAALRGAVRDIGFASVPLAYESARVGGALVWADGHMRGEELADYEGEIGILDIDDEEAAYLIATLDPIAALAETNADAMSALLAGVTSRSDAVRQLLTEMAQSAAAAREEGAAPPIGGGGDEFDVAIDEDEPPTSRSGQLWQMGRHRLIIGDPADEGVLARLFDGERATAMFTSPPYDKQRTYLDNMAANWFDMMQGVFGAAATIMEPESQLFVNLGLVHKDGRVYRYWDRWIDWMEEEGHGAPLVGWYVWDKLDGMPGDWNGRLAPAHEWIFHFTQERARPAKTIRSKRAGEKVGRTQRNPDGTLKIFTHVGRAVQPFKIPDSVVRLAPQKPDPLINKHPAPFPVGLPLSYIEAWRLPLWYDPFVGSGTMIIAAERCEVSCYACEIEPQYADVVLARWKAESGQDAVLLEE